MKTHLLLIGLNFQPTHSTGDKNFWVDLLMLFSHRCKYITIISIRKHGHDDEQFQLGSCVVNILYVKPFFLETPGVEYSRPRVFWRDGAFPKVFGVFEKLLSLRNILRNLKKIHQFRPITRIHLMDNFGLSNYFIVKQGKKIGVPVSVSAISYEGRNSIIYHLYLKLSYKNPDLQVVVYSLTFMEKMTQLGLCSDLITHIPWGVIEQPKLTSEHKLQIKKELHLSFNDRPLILWTGYIQQTKKADFLLAMETARNSLKKGLKAIFYFAFKPESLETNLLSYHSPDAGIIVKPTSVDEFGKLKIAADIFYAPMTNQRNILAPPLSWIEIMSLGTPIISTDIPGASEIIEEERTGFIAKNVSELEIKLGLACRNKRYSLMKNDCRTKVRENYNLNIIANQYIHLWFDS